MTMRCTRSSACVRVFLLARLSSGLGDRCRYPALLFVDKMSASILNFDQAWELVGGLLLIPENSPLGELERRDRQSLETTAAALTANTSLDKSDLWLLGKIEQRLGDYQRSLGYFLRANSLQPNDLDVVASGLVASLETGDVANALRFAENALQQWPNDTLFGELVSLAFLISGDTERAQRLASPEDELLMRKCQQIVAGHIEIPKTIFEFYDRGAG